ncbi:MAG: hypothetical protein KC561_21130 [Myxococcales bacterium]|nr:hypothetical protein [Myxococcales bacterium]
MKVLLSSTVMCLATVSTVSAEPPKDSSNFSEQLRAMSGDAYSPSESLDNLPDYYLDANFVDALIAEFADPSQMDSKGDGDDMDFVSVDADTRFGLPPCGPAPENISEYVLRYTFPFANLTD